MKRQSNDEPCVACDVSWLLQNGRSRIQRSMAADGFKGDYPYAGVVVVAENRNPEEDYSSKITVETVRDVFAEGVAFGVEDALRDSLLEAADIIRDKKLGGCSVAAVAFSGTHVWYAVAGNCRVYKIDSNGVDCIAHDQSAADEMKIPSGHQDYHKKIRDLKNWLGGSDKLIYGHTRIKQGTTFAVFTAGGWIQLEGDAITVQRKVNNKPEEWILALSKEMKLAYRRQGGAIGCISGVKKQRQSPVSWKSMLYMALFLVLIGFLVFANPFSRNTEEETKTDLFSANTVEEVVQPILLDTVSDGATSEKSGLAVFFPDSLFISVLETPVAPGIDISSDLPLQVMCLGDTIPSLNVDTFYVSLNSEPDAKWENFSPGIYSIQGDSASCILAQTISSVYPELEIIELDRIVTVRETGVAESARWLSSLSMESAAKTGVVVETRSSVAGGADWIRSYPVFVNGNRSDRALEAGGFMGDSLPGLPVLRSLHCYRLIIVQ